MRFQFWGPEALARRSSPACFLLPLPQPVPSFHLSESLKPSTPPHRPPAVLALKLQPWKCFTCSSSFLTFLSNHSGVSWVCPLAVAAAACPLLWPDYSQGLGPGGAGLVLSPTPWTQPQGRLLHPNPFCLGVLVTERQQGFRYSSELSLCSFRGGPKVVELRLGTSVLKGGPQGPRQGHDPREDFSQLRPSRP